MSAKCLRAPRQQLALPIERPTMSTMALRLRLADTEMQFLQIPLQYTTIGCYLIII
jgi:hypothetical protein